MEFVTPPPMEPGDRVAVVAPSSGGAHDAPHVLDLAVERLETVFGLDPQVHPTARQSNDFLADHPRARAAAVHEAVRDPDVSGVFATIGGWEQLRVLRHLDGEVLREHPTRFYGMSDNTNLNLALWNAGVVSYNGAQLMNELGVPGALPEYTERYCRRAFFEDSLGTLEPSAEWTDDPTGFWADPSLRDESPEYQDNDGREWRGGAEDAGRTVGDASRAAGRDANGRAAGRETDGQVAGEETVTGRLWGGCRAIVEWQLAVDSYLPDPDDLDGAILAMEMAEDLPSPEEVGGTIMCLGERGLLERFDAVLVGRVPGRSFVEEPPEEEREAYRRRVREAVVEWVGRYNPDAPVVLGLDWGHTNPIAPLPIGSEVTVDPANERIEFA